MLNMRSDGFFLIHDRLSSVKCVTVQLPSSDFPSERAQQVTTPQSTAGPVAGVIHGQPACTPPPWERKNEGERALVRFLELSPARLVTLLGLFCVKISSTCPVVSQICVKLTYYNCFTLK